MNGFLSRHGLNLYFRRTWIGIGLIGVGMLFSLSLFSPIHAQNLDIRLLRDINLHRPRSLDQAFLDITHSTIPVSLALPIGYTGVGWLEHDSLALARGLRMGLALACTAVVTEGLKRAIHRPRPYMTYPDIEHLQNDSDGSFPSGHTSLAFCTATSLALQHARWYVQIPAWTWAAAVAYSRLDLGMHYPSDVLAGMMVGAGSAWAGFRLQQWWLHKQQKKQAEALTAFHPDPFLSMVIRNSNQSLP
ncbi:phosphatase PAP2 family protein [Thermoflavifilum thermophilum]|uniref:Undecaprenyl-diphosphatase n=1 Tax=Thermoflavifilum thermophilum TaxID=1393122 RepID=A0A1I7N2D7_9BACT|nr:phosphatase PAP2 family protein [Thermoflavifilum thermophilum]SFV28808.1 undecaprenyl-diphosphatase [Thermoflavifilum thermophilum]